MLHLIVLVITHVTSVLIVCIMMNESGGLNVVVMTNVRVMSNA